ncbi:LlaJI family restriction endonuclease [Streptobacillus notomytis]
MNDFTVNGKGPKNWTKTIKTQRAYPQDDCFVYLKTISQESKVDMANYITKINEFCVYEAYKKIGFLFFENIMRKPSIVFEKKVLWFHLRKNFV